MTTERFDIVFRKLNDHADSLGTALSEPTYEELSDLARESEAVRDLLRASESISRSRRDVRTYTTS